MAFDIDPRHARGFLVGTNCVGMFAIYGVAHDDMKNHGQRQKPKHRHHTTADRLKLCRWERNRISRGPPKRNAAADQKHAQSGNKGGDFEIGHKGAINRTDKGPK